jgi:UDP-N-acetylglucosamine 2-epimerase (non-hydrolysing)
MGTLSGLSEKMDVIFPVHPRTRKHLISFGLWEGGKNYHGMSLTEPLNYLDTIGLVEKARFVITDSGGLQEETTYLKIPCLTVRPNTERPITITHGSNRLTSIETIKSDIEHILNGYTQRCEIPDLWDGNTGVRIINELLQFSKHNFNVTN